jgi:hypothetical protein
MAIALYDLSVGCFLQTLGAVDGFLEKSCSFFLEKGINADEFVETRLAPDMLPFRFQVVAVAHHSAGALEGVKAGAFAPPGPSSANFSGLMRIIKSARASLESLTPAEVNAYEGKDVIFSVRDIKMPFKAEGFLQSFSLPNFHFHATTAYDILRHKGVPLGKRDYLGRMKLAG